MTRNSIAVQPQKVQASAFDMSPAQATPAQVIVAEANRVIATLSLSTPADREMVETALESLKAVADVIAPSLGKTIGIRIVAIRNNIKVNQITLQAA